MEKPPIQIRMNTHWGSSQGPAPFLEAVDHMHLDDVSLIHSFIHAEQHRVIVRPSTT